MRFDIPLKRRNFLTIIGSLGVTTVSGCSSSEAPAQTSTSTVTSTSERTESPTTSETTQTTTARTTTESPTTTAESDEDHTKNVDKYDYEVLIEQRDKYKGAEIDATVRYVQPYQDYEGFDLVNDDSANWPFFLDIDGEFTQGDTIHFVGTIVEYIREDGWSDHVPVVGVSSFERQ